MAASAHSDMLLMELANIMCREQVLRNIASGASMQRVRDELWPVLYEGHSTPYSVLLDVSSRVASVAYSRVYVQLQEARVNFERTFGRDVFHTDFTPLRSDHRVRLKIASSVMVYEHNYFADLCKDICASWESFRKENIKEQRNGNQNFYDFLHDLSTENRTGTVLLGLFRKWQSQLPYVQKWSLTIGLFDRCLVSMCIQYPDQTLSVKTIMADIHRRMLLRMQHAFAFSFSCGNDPDMQSRQLCQTRMLIAVHGVEYESLLPIVSCLIADLPKHQRTCKEFRKSFMKCRVSTEETSRNEVLLAFALAFLFGENSSIKEPLCTTDVLHSLGVYMHHVVADIRFKHIL